MGKVVNLFTHLEKNMHICWLQKFVHQIQNADCVVLCWGKGDKNCVIPQESVLKHRCKEEGTTEDDHSVARIV